MKKQITRTFSLSALAFAFAWNAYANITVTQAAGDIMSALGVLAAQTATKTCDIPGMIQTYTPPGADGGRLSAINVIPCVLNTLGLTGSTGSTGSTKPNAVTVNGVPLSVHVIVNTAGSPAIDGVTYTNEVKVWGCTGTCSTASAYYAMAYMAFSADSAGTINKGILALNSNAQSGDINESQFVRWDTGSATTSKAIDNIDAECGGTTATNIRTYSYKRVGDDAQAATLSANGGGMAESWNWTSNAGVYGGDSGTAVAGGTPTYVNKFSRTVSTNDYTYTDGGGTSTATLLPYPSFLSIATMNSSDYLGMTCSTITSTGFPKVITGAGILTTPMTAMGGMNTHPDNI